MRKRKRGIGTRSIVALAFATANFPGLPVPVPAPRGKGFGGLGCGFSENPGVRQPVWVYPPKPTENLATAKKMSIDTAMHDCEVKIGGKGGGRRGNGAEMR